MDDIGNRHDDTAVAARDILKKMLDLMGVEATVTISEEFPVEGEKGLTSFNSLNIEGDDLGILIGRRGQTLAALQYMIRLILCHQTQQQAPIIIDVESYKRRRYDSLRSLARRIAEEVKTRRRSFTLEPMPAFERRIVHLTLANNPDVTTESTGFGEARKVVIKPKNA
ncbi:MAG: KH domain-containing protein [Dehalococcoidales bacterium]|nr:KH domain-containing protein [Dehalococcoidales bacterium]